MSVPVYDVSLSSRVPPAAAAPTLSEVDPVTRWSSLRWERALNEPDTYRVTAEVAALSSTLADRLSHLDATPLELVIRRDGDIVGCGPVVEWEITGGEITLYARGLLYYLDYMVVEGEWARVEEDQATVVADLVDYYQDLAYGHYGLDTSSLTAVGVDRTLSIASGEFPAVGQKVRDWLDNLNGMDIWVDPATRAIERAYPQRGSDLTASVVLDSRVIRDTTLRMSVAAGVLASEGFATSSGGGTEPLVGTYSDTALRATFGRSGAAAGSSSISETATVDALAEMIQTDRSAPLVSLGLDQFIGVAGVDVGDFDCGDTVGFVHDSGLGIIETEVRIRRWGVDVSPTREMLEVGFS